LKKQKNRTTNPSPYSPFNHHLPSLQSSPLIYPKPPQQHHKQNQKGKEDWYWKDRTNRIRSRKRSNRRNRRRRKERKKGLIALLQPVLHVRQGHRKCPDSGEILLFQRCFAPYLELRFTRDNRLCDLREEKNKFQHLSAIAAAPPPLPIIFSGEFFAGKPI
jgi:hypothetical protein